MYYKLISCLPIYNFDQQYKKQIIDVGCKVNLWLSPVGQKVKEIQGHRMACSQVMSYCLTTRSSHRANSRSGRTGAGGLNWSNNESGFWGAASGWLKTIEELEGSTGSHSLSFPFSNMKASGSLQLPENKNEHNQSPGNRMRGGAQMHPKMWVTRPHSHEARMNS